ncbi:MAG TPA: hypothetical protein VKB92_10500 [Myxococcales bacterium]|nr:hypothetical protein [Myxococcales bacterium]
MRSPGGGGASAWQKKNYFFSFRGAALRAGAALAAVALAAVALAACTKGPPQGRRLASGLARDLIVAPGGGMVAFLQGAYHPDDRGVPEDLLLGELMLASTSGDSAAQPVRGGVATIPAARAFSPGGEWLAFLAGWRFRVGDGELWLAGPPGAARKVANGVSAMGWAPSGSLVAFVAHGRLMVLDASKEPASPSLALDQVQSFAWSPGADRLAGRAPGAIGGRVQLMEVRTARRREVTRASSDFAFGADGSLYVLGLPGAKGGDRPLSVLATFDGKPREIGRATSFAVSDRYVALLSTDRQPGEAFGALSRVPRAGGAAEPLGERVNEFRFAPGGDLVFLARYDALARAGALTAAAPGKPPREIAQRTQSFTAQGDRLLYLAQAPQKGDFKIELWTAPLDGSAPARKVDDGVYGYQLTPDGKQLFWKARCAGGARSCSLFRAPADGSGAAQLLAADVAGFELSADAGRVLVQKPHRGAARAVDLAVLDAGAMPPSGAAVKLLATEVDPSSGFVDARGRRMVYAAMAGAGQAGVYLLDLP